MSDNAHKSLELMCPACGKAAHSGHSDKYGAASTKLHMQCSNPACRHTFGALVILTQSGPRDANHFSQNDKAALSGNAGEERILTDC
jgi:hypothetical protein